MVVIFYLLFELSTNGEILCHSHQLILASLYESSSLASSAMKTFGSTKNPKGTLLLAGPFRLLQLWLTVTFEPYLTNNNIDHPAGEPKVWPVEGSRLALLTPSDRGLSIPKSFTEYYMMFAKRYNFTAPMVPFVDRRHGPVWFKREFPTCDPAHQVESNEI